MKGVKLVIFIIIAFVLLTFCTKRNYLSQVPSSPKQGNEVSLASAEEQLNAFLSSSGIITKSGGRRVIKDKYSIRGLLNTKSSSSEAPLYHIFNFADNGGYAIVSGDRRTPAILAVTDKGSFSISSLSENNGEGMLLTNIDTYCRILQNLPVFDADGNIVESDSIYNYGIRDSVIFEPSLPAVEYIYEHHGSIIPCEWGQRSPFNELCFTPQGQQAPAGCVPVAMGQIMYYWEFNSTYNNVYYDWNYMSRIQDTLSTDTTGWALVKSLLKTLGDPENLNATYRPTSTGASPDRVGLTFENFGYASGGSFVPVNPFEMVSSLDEGPVMMGGHSFRTDTYDDFGNLIAQSYSGGHAWVVDKVIKVTRVRTQEEINQGIYYPLYLYFHVNWGWYGNHNGYFLYPSFDVNNPDTVPTRTETIVNGNSNNYQYLLKMNCGIRPINNNIIIN